MVVGESHRGSCRVAENVPVYPDPEGLATGPVSEYEVFPPDELFVVGQPTPNRPDCPAHPQNSRLRAFP